MDYGKLSKNKLGRTLKFTFVTLFQNLIEPYFYDSILKRAVEANFIEYEFYNPRDFTKNKHLKVDAPMIGGGAGMLMTVITSYSIHYTKLYDVQLKFI